MPINNCTAKLIGIKLKGIKIRIENKIFRNITFSEKFWKKKSEKSLIDGIYFPILPMQQAHLLEPTPIRSLE